MRSVVAATVDTQLRSGPIPLYSEIFGTPPGGAIKRRS
jgi:uncharacterized protein YraI